MKTILITVYAVNPYKGSEEGTGWNLTCQVAKKNKVIAVTRKNNRSDIERYMHAESSMEELFSRIEFLYFDLPKWTIKWKKGPLLSALYFYIWQFSVALWLKKKNVSFDIAHSLNFHSNWTPTFLWILGKPFVWGPVGNHPSISKQYIKNIYGTKAYLKDRMLWFVKTIFWNLDPFLYISKKKAIKIFCVNSQAKKKLRLPAHKVVFMPAVASEMATSTSNSFGDEFIVLSVGRFVPLKGFDLTIKSFSKFYKSLPANRMNDTRLVIIGTGPEKSRLQRMIQNEKLEHAITIYEWMPRAEVIERFSNSSVYLFPSHEGAGMVVAEAMSYGLPVICIDNYGPGEYVHPDSSLKVPEDSYEATVNELAMRLQNLCENELLYEKEKKLALQRYISLFQWNKKGEIMQQVYDDIAFTKVIQLNHVQLS